MTILDLIVYYRWSAEWVLWVAYAAMVMEVAT